MLEETWRQGKDTFHEGSADPSAVITEQVKNVDLDGNESPDIVVSKEGSTEKEIDPPEEFQSLSSSKDAAVVRRTKFHRSISIGSPKGKEWSPPPSGARVIMSRKRNSSYEDSIDHHSVST